LEGVLYVFHVPLLLIPIAIYHMIAFLTPDLAWTQPLTSIPTASGRWTLTLGELLVFFALVMLFGEIFKAARPGTRGIVDHMLSLLIAAGMIVEFALWPQFVNSTYAMLIMIALLDLFGGFAISVRSAPRREFAEHV
jgi:uncharacterized membrane protein